MITKLETVFMAEVIFLILSTKQTKKRKTCEHQSSICMSMICHIVADSILVLNLSSKSWKPVNTNILLFCSMQNWAEDLYFKELDLNYPGVTDAMVGLSIPSFK